MIAIINKKGKEIMLISSVYDAVPRIGETIIQETKKLDIKYKVIDIIHNLYEDNLTGIDIIVEKT